MATERAAEPATVISPVMAMEPATEIATKRPILKVIILGDLGVGKTSLITQFVYQQFKDDYKATMVPQSFWKEIHVGGEPVTVQVWDTVGQRSHDSSFYGGADCCMLVYMCHDMNAVDSLDFWRNEFLMKACPLNLMTFPFAVVASKVDAPCEIHPLENKVKEWCASSDIPHFQTSAKDEANVRHAFISLAALALKRRDDEQKLPCPELFVGGLPHDTFANTQGSLETHFRSYGPFSLKVPVFKRGDPRGFALLKFTSKASLQRALDDEHFLGGKKLELKLSRNDSAPSTTKTLMVKDIPIQTKGDTLKATFRKYGNVKRYNFIPHNMSVKHAFVTFDAKQSLDVFFASNEAQMVTIGGAQCRVERALRSKKK